MKWVARVLGAALVLLAAVVVAFALQARARLPDLQAWHQLRLDNEFNQGRAASFTEYLALEQRLFAELKQRILEDRAAADATPIGRYNPGSVPAQLALDTPWNRSFELVPGGQPRGSVLLVHGLSDSPYSVRALAETFVAQGWYVVGLRLPGHGTIPSGLLEVRWEDWYAAVVLAAKHAVQRGGRDKPFIAGGHSTGAALLTLYSLRTRLDPTLPTPRELHLVSAAIGVSPFAVLTNVISALSFVPGFEKADWIDVLPEYDPYKYNSFPVNAANQIYQLTREVQDTIDALAPERLAGMPRLHLYQSIVDSTVRAHEIVHGLLARLPAGGHELFIFDVNRHEQLQGLVAPGPLADLEAIRAATDLPFRVAVVSNRGRDTRAVAMYTREAGASDVTTRELPLEWPQGVFSVGHVALPFPVDDPVYGLAPPADGPGFHLGTVAIKGESGALIVGLGTFARLRCNPFFEVIRANLIATS